MTSTPTSLPDLIVALHGLEATESPTFQDSSAIRISSYVVGGALDAMKPGGVAKHPEGNILVEMYTPKAVWIPENAHGNNDLELFLLEHPQAWAQKIYIPKKFERLLITKGLNKLITQVVREYNCTALLQLVTKGRGTVHSLELHSTALQRTLSLNISAGL